MTGVQTCALPISRNVDPPRSAAASISGRVLTHGGVGIGGVKVTATDPLGGVRTVNSSSFGLYRFDGVLSPETYTVRATSKRYRFHQRVIQVTGDATDIDFLDQEDPLPFVDAGMDLGGGTV